MLRVCERKNGWLSIKLKLTATDERKYRSSPMDVRTKSGQYVMYDTELKKRLQTLLMLTIIFGCQLLVSFHLIKVPDAGDFLESKRHCNSREGLCLNHKQ